MESELFKIKLKKIQFSPWGFKLAHGLLYFSILVAMLTQFILYLPISLDLKAILLGTDHFYLAILVIAGLSFIISALFIMYGGEKKYKGYMSIQNEKLSFELKNNSFNLLYADLEKIQQYKKSDSNWEWKFFTNAGRFTLTFVHVIETYKADNRLREVLMDNYDSIIKKE